MNIDTRSVLPLRLVMIALFGVLLVLQFLSFPGQFAYMAETNPQDAYLRWPLTAMVMFLILCAEVIIVSTWRLLGYVQDGRIFTKASFVWVDAIVWAIGAAWVVITAVFVWFGSQADDPGGPMLMFFIVLVIAVVGLLMVVMRALLRQATALRADMEAVI